MKTRRQFLRSTVGAAAALAVTARLHGADEKPGIELNDVQSQLNATRVHQIVKPTNMDQVAEVLAAAAKDNRAVSVAGGRHSMGGQQFGSETLHLDLTGMSRVLKLDREKGRIEVEAGIQWPELLSYLHKEQAGQASAWTIRQKQTGVDRVTMAGTLSANAHARGLKFKPIIDDVESFVLVDAKGEARIALFQSQAAHARPRRLRPDGDHFLQDFPAWIDAPAAPPHSWPLARRESFFPVALFDLQNADGQSHRAD